jgi:hypothetical protein
MYTHTKCMGGADEESVLAHGDLEEKDSRSDLAGDI